MEAEVLALRRACASMAVSDALLSNLSQAGVLAALQALFNVSASDFLEHPLFREAAYVDPTQFPDHSRHALVTALCEQGVRLSAAILAWLRPLSMIGTEMFDIAQIWGSQPKHELRIVASRLVFCIKAQRLEFALSPFLRSRLETAASLAQGHPDLEAARLAVYQEVKRSGWPVVNDIMEPEREDGEVEEAQQPTLQQVLAAWQPPPGPSPLRAMALPSGLAKARAILAYDVTTHGPESPQEIMAKVTLLHQENLIAATEKASAAKFPRKEAGEFYSGTQAAHYNDKMNACRTLEIVLQSHSDEDMSMELRCALDSLQQQIAQEALAISLTATLGFAAGKTFQQAVAFRQAASFESIYVDEIDQAKAAQAAADGAAGERSAKRLKASTQGSWNANGWWQGSPGASSDEAQKAGSPGSGRKRGPKSGSAQAGKASAPVAALAKPAPICFTCGVSGHKSDACHAQWFVNEHTSGPAPPSRGWNNWQVGAPSPVQPVSDWGSEWDEEPDQNARPGYPNARQDWAQWSGGATKGTGKSGGKGGGKHGSGKAPKWGDGGASQGPKGGGKGGGWPTGGRGKGYSWSKGS